MPETIRELAKKNIENYCQDNPFDVNRERAKWRQYNLVYQEELDKFFRDKTQVFYHQYYEEVGRRERDGGQMLLFDNGLQS